MPSAISATHAASNSPAQYVRTNNAGLKGADFGAMVSARAKVKHAPEPIVVSTAPTVPPIDGEPGSSVNTVA